MLGHDLAEVLPELQAEAESMMVDACKVTRGATGDWVIDPDTGYEVPAEGAVVYEGMCKVATYAPYEVTPNVGGATIAVQRYTVHAPVTAGPFEIGDLITITGGQNQPLTVGRTFRVGALHEKTWQTSQRLFVDEGA